MPERPATHLPVQAIWAVGLLILGGCTSTDSPVCSTEFPGGMCLDLSEAGGLVAHRSTIEEEVSTTLEMVRPLLGASDLRIVILDDPSGVIPETGFGGYNPNVDEVRLFADSDRPDVEAEILAELSPTLAHEIHHAMRRRAIGYGSTLLQAAVSEGLADHFSNEITPGYDPPWTRALTEEQLSIWMPEVLAGSTGTYDHSEWFFGSGSVPRWTGYSVGFELVRLYLEARPDQRASTLVGEPELSFVPPDP